MVDLYKQRLKTEKRLKEQIQANTADLERALAAEQRLEAVLEQSADGIYITENKTQTIAMANQAFSDTENEPDMVVSGQTNLMDFDELAQMDRLRSLFDAFTEKQEILHLLDRCLEADGVQIYIGEESGYQTLKDCSVVTAPYEVDDEVIGVLGVVGPTRMAYDKVIPIVDITAKLLGAALKSR